ncbi:hypothetical protein B296_00008610 [Ensete ventricosum]|uniref:SMAX1-like nucleotide binding domain-containing protein n=1 Tax=Ensete ventricosum TaxID=4639 RepID=A0A427B695_ENSVE|nr:hypothetical protein B296_00008610 [Ensete ventricosum]
MRAGLSAILQTLTPEAASVLTRSVKEAARRKHGQTTPLHVAATLLAAPSGLLRRACLSSHSDTAHPLRVLSNNLSIHASPARNLYMNPRLYQHRHSSGATAGGGLEEPRREEVKRVMDILLRSKKRNSVLVGDSDPDAVMKEVLHKIESGDAPPPLNTAQVVSFAKQLATAAVASDLSWIPAWITELGASIESEMSGRHGVVLDLGDLSWLVESPVGASIASAGSRTRQIVCEVGRAVVAEMGKLVKRFEDRGRLWLVGTATCATYLRCQVYHPAMENDWDLQVLPIASRQRTFPR